mgnify:CR=1 FL=1
MPIETLNGPFSEVRASSTAGGGTALTTAAQVVPFLPGTSYASWEARNYSTAVVVKYALVPYILVYKTVDLLATISDYSDAAQDGDTATDVVLSSLDTLANGDALWIGSPLPFRALIADVDAANGNSATLTGVYWSTASAALTNISLTDNTASGGAPFAIDGTITWTVPTDWGQVPLTVASGIATTVAAAGCRSIGRALSFRLRSTRRRRSTA